MHPSGRTPGGSIITKNIMPVQSVLSKNMRTHVPQIDGKKLKNDDGVVKRM